jgi:glycosyltransferase involved in cell wall biosynthesis
MTFMLILLGSALALELLIYFVRPLWRARKVLAVGALLLGSFGWGALVVASPSVFLVLVSLVGLYRIFNLIRIVQQRMHEQYMRFATRRTGLVLLAVQAVVTACWWLWEAWQPAGYVAWTVLSFMQLVGAGLLLWSVRRNFSRMSWPAQQHNYTDSELPTLTVAIPARNETEDLQQCLQSIIASDYPKLEIIVLDDCSQLRRTPEIIKGFAHAGVRFVQGRDPSDTWLPKNHAYRRLAEEASGAYILFCGVDVRFQPHTLREAMAVLLDRKKTMLSILPQREHDAYGHLSLIQAMRYWWELAPPRRLFSRPPVLSTCWIIQAKALHDAGGFGAARRTILPEAHFARTATRTDGYSFLRASRSLGLTSNKQVSEQRDTAVRMRYPQLHRRPENVLVLAAVQLFFLLLPFVMAVGGLWISIGWLAWIGSLVSVVCLVATYQMVVLGTHVNSWWFSVVGHPLMIAVDIALLHYSMWKYEYDTVDWKGRNVCIPVMHVVPRLPKI